jgi:hypothetical protein
MSKGFLEVVYQHDDPLWYGYLTREREGEETKMVEGKSLAESSRKSFLTWSLCFFHKMEAVLLFTVSSSWAVSQVLGCPYYLII